MRPSSFRRLPTLHDPIRSSLSPSLSLGPGEPSAGGLHRRPARGHGRFALVGFVLPSTEGGMLTNRAIRAPIPTTSVPCDGSGREAIGRQDDDPAEE